MDSRIVIGKESPAYSTHTIAEERLVLDKQFSEDDKPANVGMAYHPKLNFLAPRPRFLYYKPKSRPLEIGDDTCSEEKVKNCDLSTPSDVGNAYHPKLNNLAPRPRFLYYKPKSRPLELGDDTCSEEKVSIGDLSTPSDIGNAYHPKLNNLAPRPRFLYYKPKSRPLELGDDTCSEEKVGICDLSTPSDIGNAYHPKLNNLAPRPRFLYYKPKSRSLELGDDTCSEEKVSISDVSTTSDVGQEFSDDGSREQPLSRVSDATERVDGSSLLHYCRIGRTCLRGFRKTLLSFLILLCWVTIMLNPIRTIGFSWKDNSRCLSRSFLVKTPILKSDKNDDFTNNFSYFTNNFSDFYIRGIHTDGQLDHANTAETDGIPIDDPPHLNFDDIRRHIDDVPNLNPEVIVVFVYFKFVETVGIHTDREAIMSSQVNEIQVLPELLKLRRSSKHADSSSNSCSHVTQNHIYDVPNFNSEVIVVFVFFKFIETVGIHTAREGIISSQVNEIQVLPELLKLRRSSKHADSSSNSSSHVSQNHINDVPILNSEVIIVFVYILLYIIAGICAYFGEPSLGNGSTEMSVPVESYPSKLCTFQMGSYEDLEKKRKKIYRTKTLSSLDSISGSASYGSFIVHEKVSNKRGSGDAAIVAPVRRSWRIQNRVVRGVGIANA